ncbi:LacI family DNA-binding transcriptional regulator [Paenibacillus sp. S150]|uniref:LacI family DNA-binding transcriptional regulator n=1 Tax=Paenibacillus sp. S150 TaxID=2749826 RepID=UPI001C57290A|nr:LacI family DNA-binding transcriptional regulator [Paenibacillus sp. S150]MBW4083146.1 LacI family DNA-binding transcriptional regulator [Paenibacillus sp. S150]
MTRKISTQTLADQLGLSKYAVSRALSGKSGVSEATRARVVELARTLGYQHSASAAVPQAFPEDSSSLFVLICVNQLNRGERHYWERVLGGMVSASSERGWHHVIISPSLADVPDGTPPEKAVAPHLDWRSCAGIAVMGSFTYPTLRILESTGKPLVLVDHHDPLLRCDKVTNDNIEAGAAIARHLLSLGCRRIGYIGDLGVTPSFAERKAGIRLALENYASMEIPLLDWGIPYEQKNWSDKLPGWMEQLEQLPPSRQPDGWIGANDDIAIQWMNRLKESGLKVPEDCRVAGIDNVYAATQSSPELTTIHLSKEEMGQRAIEALQRRLERPGTPMERIMLATSLITRGST